ncbi:MAG TPA: hypothetical protein VIK81_04745 [Patescibacteria group bacterium]
MPIQPEIIANVKEKEEQAAREIEALIASAVKNFDFPQIMACINKEGKVGKYDGLWVTKGGEEALILNSDGLFRAPILGVYNYYNSIPSFYVPDTTKLEKASTSDLLQFGRLSLEKLIVEE